MKIKELESIDGKDIVQVYQDYWWIVNGEGNVLFNKSRSPLCNSNSKIVESIRDKMFPDCEVKQIPVAFLEIDPADYVW